MLKDKLKRGNLLYKPYLYYNLFIHHKCFLKREKYSQGEEDKFINYYFKNKLKGFYIDIGCYHPILYSNTAKLYNKGWSGINLDLNQTSIDLFNIVRKRDKNFCAAISNQNNDVNCYIDSNFSPLNSLNKKFSDYTIKKFSKGNSTLIKVKTFKLLKLLELNKIYYNDIDFINIDVESHDLEVLQGIDFTKIKPKLLCVEMFNESGDINSLNIRNLLKEFNYSMIHETGGNGFFERSK